VALASIDKTSTELISGTQLDVLAASMADYDPTMQTGDLLGQWQSAIETSAITPPIPRTVLSAIRVYERFFYLP
jgi:hypothetical protein